MILNRGTTRSIVRRTSNDDSSVPNCHYWISIRFFLDSRRPGGWVGDGGWSCTVGIDGDGQSELLGFRCTFGRGECSFISTAEGHSLFLRSKKCECRVGFVVGWGVGFVVRWILLWVL